MNADPTSLLSFKLLSAFPLIMSCFPSPPPRLFSTSLLLEGEKAYKGRKKSGNGRELPSPEVMLNRKRHYKLDANATVLSELYYYVKLPASACKEFHNFIFNFYENAFYRRLRCR